MVKGFQPKTPVCFIYKHHLIFIMPLNKRSMGHGKRFIAKVEADNNDYTTAGTLGGDSILTGTRQNGTWTADLSALSGGGGGASGSVKASALYSIPFYSGSAYGDTVSGASGFSYYQGNVGVNLNINPTYPLHVSQSSGDTYGMYQINSAGRGIYFGDTSNNGTGYGKIGGVGGSLFLGSTQVYTSFLGTGDANTTLGSSGRRWSYFYTRYGAFGYKTSVTEGTDYVIAVSSATTKHPMIVRDSQYGTPLVITSGGNVGVGTTAPGYSLVVSGSAPEIQIKGNTPRLRLEDIDTGRSDWNLGLDSAQNGLNFAEVGVADNRLFLAAGGKVGIGTSSPNYELDVSSTDPQIALTDTNGVTYYFMSQSNHFYLHDQSNGATRLFFQDSTGYMGVNTVTPEATLNVSGHALIGSGASGYLDKLYIGNKTKGIYGYNNRLDFYITSNPRAHIDASSFYSTTNFGPKLDLTPGPLGTANYGFVGDENTGMSRGASDKLHLLTAGVSGVTVVPAYSGSLSQNVGIGTTSPSYLLDLYSSGTSHAVRFKNASTNGYVMRLDAGGDNSNIQFQTDHIIASQALHMMNDNANMYLRTSGYKVGIGTSSPKTEMTLNGALSFLSGSVTSPDGYRSIWASGSKLFWGDQEVYTNAPGTSEITGAGSANQVSYFTATSNITGSTNLVFDGTNLNPKEDFLMENNKFIKFYQAGGSTYHTSIGYNSSNELQLGGLYGVKIRTYSGGWGDRVIIASDGDVTIGGTEHGEKLQVSGNIRIDGGTADNRLVFDNHSTVFTSDSNDSGMEMRSWGGTKYNYPIKWVGASGASNYNNISFLDDFVMISGSKMGIGTTSPREYLEINSSADDDPAFRLTNSRAGTSGSLQIQHRGSSINFKSEEDIPMRFSMSNTEVMRTNADDTLSIGNTSAIASGKLTVLNATNPQLTLASDGSNYNSFKTKDDGALEIKRNGTAAANRIALLSGTNILIGQYAGYDINSSQTGESVLIGDRAGFELKGNEPHGRHTIIGAQAVYTMSGTTDSDYITAIGAYCAYGAKHSKGFTAIGPFAGYYLSGSGDGPLLLGNGAGKGTALGAWGTTNGVTMNEDVLIGNGGVAEYAETLSQNTIVGSRAAGFMRVGTQNVAVGRFAMRNASGTQGTTGNVAIGQSAGAGIGQDNDGSSASSYNIAIGYETQEKSLAGDRNIAIGYKVGIDGDSAVDDILRIGNAAGDYSFIRGDMANNNLCIGAGTPKFTISGSNVGVGTTRPWQQLHLTGDMLVEGSDIWFGTTDKIKFRRGGTNYFDMLTSGNSAAGLRALGLVATNSYGTSPQRGTLTLQGLAAANKPSTVTGYGLVWASGTAGEKLYYRQGDGTDHDLTAAGGGGGGTISGTVAANQVAYGTYSDTLGGSSNLTFDGTRFSSHVRIADDKKLLLGNSSDLQLYHSAGASSYFTNGTNALIIWNQDAAGGTLKLRNDRQDYGIQFDISGTEVGRFTRVGGAGRLGLGGTTAPNSTLDVAGTITAGTNSRMTIDDNKVKVNGDDLYISGSHDIYLDANGANIYLSDGGDKFGALNNNNAYWDFDAKSHAHYLRFITSGGLTYWGDGTDNQTIYVRSTGGIGTNDIKLAANNTSWFNGGNVGIGTSSPSEELHVVGDTLVSGSSYIQGTDSGYTKWKQTVNGNGKWQLFQGSTQRIIGSSGEFQFANDVIVDGAIGVAASSISSGYKLDVDGKSFFRDNIHLNDSAGDPYVQVGDDGNNNVFFQWNSTGDYAKIQSQSGGSTSASDILALMPDAGKVGVGTATPDLPFVVSGSQYDMAKIGSTHSAGASLYLDAKATGGSLWHLQSTANGAGTGGGKLDFVEAGTSRMVIDAGGDVGIGTTGPDGKLDVRGTFYVNSSDSGNTVAHFTSNDGLCWAGWNDSSTSDTGQVRVGANGNKLVLIGGGKEVVRMQPGDSDIIWNYDGYKHADHKFVASGGATTMYLDNSTNARVGIGTTGPDRELHVHKSSTSVGLKLSNDSTGQGSADGFYIDMGATDAEINNKESGKIAIATANSTRMTILAGGNVGIGTTAPTTKLDVHGTTLLSGTTNVVGDLGVSSDLIVTGSTLSVQKTIKNDIAGTHTISDSYSHYLATADNAGSATCTITAPASPSIGDEYFIVARCVYLAAAPGSALVRITPNTGQTINAEVNAGSYIALNTLSSGAGAAGGPLMTYRTAHLICVEGDTWSLTLSDVGPTS